MVDSLTSADLENLLSLLNKMDCYTGFENSTVKIILPLAVQRPLPILVDWEHIPPENTHFSPLLLSLKGAAMLFFPIGNVLRLAELHIVHAET